MQEEEDVRLVERLDPRLHLKDTFEHSQLEPKLPLFVYAVDFESDPESVLLLCSGHRSACSLPCMELKKEKCRVHNFIWLEFKAIPPMLEAQSRGTNCYPIGATMREHIWPPDLQTVNQNPVLVIRKLEHSTMAVHGLLLCQVTDTEFSTILSSESLIEELGLPSHRARTVEYPERKRTSPAVALYAQEVLKLLSRRPGRMMKCPNPNRIWHAFVSEREPVIEPVPVKAPKAKSVRAKSAGTDSRKRQRKVVNYEESDIESD